MNAIFLFNCGMAFSSFKRSTRSTAMTAHTKRLQPSEEQAEGGSLADTNRLTLPANFIERSIREPFDCRATPPQILVCRRAIDS